MTSTSTGIGGSVGGPPQPSTFELETTAATHLNRAALGIVADSIEQSFVLNNPRYHFGYLGGFGYKSSAGQPLLDHPLESSRITQGFEQPASTSWNAIYEELVNQLPPDLLNRFLANGNKPFDSRNMDLTAFDNVLVLASKVFSQAANLSQPIAEGSLEEARTMLNLLLPFAALKGAIGTSSEIVQSAQDFIANLGANYRYFDSFNSAFSDMQKGLALLDQINSNLIQTPGWELSSSTKALAGQASALFATLAGQLQRTTAGNDLQILLPILNALSIVAAALSLPNTSTAPLYLSLNIALTGFNTTESPQSGVPSPDFNGLMDSLVQGIVENTMPDANPASTKLIQMFAISSFVALAGLAALAVSNGIGPLPARSANDVDAARFFAFATALHLVASSNTLRTLYQEIIDAAGGNSQAQQLGSSTLALLALLTALLAGAYQGGKPTDSLVETEQNSLNQGVLSAEEIASNIQISPDHQQAAAVSIALQQGKIALDNHDYEGFMNAFNQLIDNLGASSSSLYADIETIGNDAQKLTNIIGQKNPDDPMTRIINIV